YVESLTNALEERALALMAKVEELGGAAQAIEAGFFQEEIGRSAYEQQLRIESGETVIVGVNRFADEQEPPVIPTPDFSRLARDQVERLRAVKEKRDGAAVKRTLDALGAAAPGYLGAGAREPLMPLIVDAVRARASVGEIADVLRGVWGVYAPGR
ncbi:MAG: methylmalonyl-CoA mutase, partial [Gemmatimonadaceae bacterium]|nr:methylmalonyl-CoA mutase [Gemmatimonadaceae bacterium]